MTDDDALRVAEAALLALLARLFAAELDEETVSILAAAEFLPLVEAACHEAAADLARDWTADDLEEAAVEYCRLFVQPGGTAPIAAAWLASAPSDAVNPVASMVSNLVDAGQLELPDSLSSLPHDHLAVLLCIASELRQSDAPVATDFMGEALGSWTPRFADALERTATSPVYRLAARWLSSLTTPASTEPHG